MRCFGEVDLAQAEWVVTAFISQDPRMLEVVYKKLDAHLVTGALISKAPHDFILMESTLVGHQTDPDVLTELRQEIPKVWNGESVKNYFLPRTMSIRQAGKKSNHGLNYNMQPARFALENGLPESDAKRIVHAYRHDAYPNLKDFYSHVELRLRKDGRVLTNCYGQTRKFLDRWGPELLDSAYAFYPQSTVGNITGWGWRAVYSDTENLRRVEPVAQIHDSIAAQHTFDDLEELRDQLEICVKYMATPFIYHNREHTIRREVKIGLDWAESSMVEVPVSDEGGIDLQDVAESWEACKRAA